jgi:pilus assembly protein CpaB
VLLVVSVVLAAVATLLLRGHLTRLEARAAAGGPGVAVVMAAVDIERGDVLSGGAVEVGRVPARYVPPGAVRSVEGALGRVAIADLRSGEVVTETRLATGGGPLAAMVPAGLRAVAVTVGVPPGPLLTQDRVDVLATYAGGQPHAETVISSAEVLTVRGADDAIGEASTVVLLVSPDDAERLAFARSFAELSLAVVSAEETP